MVLEPHAVTFGIDHLPYGSVVDGEGGQRAVVRLGDDVLDLAEVDRALFATGTLDALLASGPQSWADVRGRAGALLERGTAPLIPLASVRPVLAFTVTDYVDFYASEHHATNAGRIFRPDGPHLPEHWKHLPIGYHGRSGSLVPSGTPIERPAGVRGAGGFGPSRRLDFEAEVAFVVGVPGRRVPVADADRHVFGVSLLNDWSARDIQAYETVPLGPFLGKSFATSISPWITPLAALDAARVDPPPQDPRPVEQLRESGDRHGLDLQLEVRLNGTLLSRPRFAGMYWTYAQMLAHLTSNGSWARTGDVFASGTVSGPQPDQRGCLLELTWDGQEPIRLADGAERTWLADGDEVVITATAGGLTLGEVSGRVHA